MKAAIKEARLLRISDVWPGHKPKGLSFSETDVIIISWIKDGERFEQDFYCRLKADGTLGNSITRHSEKLQKDLQAVIRKYVSKEKRYNIRARIGEWKGKEVELEKVDGVCIIKI